MGSTDLRIPRYGETVNNGSRQKTAEELGISMATLWRKMKKYGIAE